MEDDHDLSKLSDHVKKLTSSDRKRYFDKIRLTDGTQLPDPFSLDNWSDDIAHLPDLSWIDVYTYLIDTPSVYTKEALKAWKSLDAYGLYACGHVQDCAFNAISASSDFCYIRAKVMPSQRQGQLLYDTWVCLNKPNAWILSANCTCMAGYELTFTH
jgi:hypothetical protein